MYDFDSAVRRYLGGKQYRNYHTFAVKVKSDNVQWRQSSNNANVTPTRVVQMENNTHQPGTGHMSIEKAGKPILQFTIHQNAVKGFEKRIKFTGPRDVVDTFFAKVNGASQIVDCTGLHVDTQVPLPGNQTAYAEVRSREQGYRGELSCQLNMSGNVIVIHDNDSVSEIPVSELGFPRTFPMTATLDVQFQDSHAINVS